VTVNTKRKAENHDVSMPKNPHLVLHCSTKFFLLLTHVFRRFCLPTQKICLIFQ